MKKIAFIMGTLEILLGLITFISTSILNEVMPKLGRLAFQSVMNGSYSSGDYKMNFAIPNNIGVILCVLGIVTITYFVFIKKEDK